MTTPFPQLRVRTGYSYRNAYGRMPEIIERLQQIGCESAAMVDSGTWANVRWEQAMLAAGLNPMFGMEIPFLSDSDFKPKVWVLAEDTRKFYRLTTKSVRAGGLSADDLAEAEGVIRFCGGAMDLPPDSYDYVDINPSSYVHAYNGVAKARRDGKPMVITSYNDMPDRKHESFAYAWEVRDSVGVRWIATEEEIRDAALKSMSSDEFAAAAEATRLIASRLATTRLAKAPMIRLDGDLTALAREGQAHRLAMGHIKEWTAEYEERFKLEIEQITIKNFDSYFLVVSDLIRYAKQHMLVGPGRGKARWSSLVCYFCSSTRHVDPLYPA